MEVKKIINAAMKWNVKESDLDQAIYDEVEKDPTGFVEALIEGLAPLIEVGESPLTGKRYKGFSVEPGMWAHKVEVGPITSSGDGAQTQ